LKNGDKIGKAWIMIFQISISMIVPMAMCGALGWYLDGKFGTGFLFILFLLLGILASFRNVYYLTRQFYQKDMEKEHAELAYFENLKKEGKQAREKAKQDKG
jgi:F0F1-type ATP synthase assembly protein I